MGLLGGFVLIDLSWYSAFRLIFIGCLWVLLGSGLSSSSWAKESTSDRNLKQLFRIDTDLPKKFKKGPHTFVVFVNGAADHYVPPSFSEIKQKWGKADAKDVAEIKTSELSCEGCNLLLLHIQRGGSRWYTPQHAFATYLRGYSAGKKIFSRHVSLINAADPKTLSLLLSAAQALFPATDIHLIYRGHGFSPSYDPKATPQEIAPFDYNHKDSPFGIKEWIEGIQGAKLTQPLGSITFAACSMAYLEVAEKIAPHAKYMLAPQIDVIETLKFGFDYDFFRLIPFTPASDRAIPQTLARILMERFQTRPPSLDTKTEEPISLIDLSKIPSLKARLNTLIDATLLKPNAGLEQIGQKTLWQDLLKKTHVSVALSERHIKTLIQLGKPEKEALAYAEKFQTPVRNPNEIDLVSFLNWLKAYAFESKENQTLTEAENRLRDEISALATEFRSTSVVEVFNPSPYAKHYGLSLDAALIRKGLEELRKF